MSVGAVTSGHSDADVVLDDVTVEFASGDYVVRPVERFSARVNDGSLALLLGPSGCGKTTLLSCLAAILRPTKGSIRHGGREIAGLSGTELTDFRRHGVGIVFQAFNLVSSLTALENVALPMRCAGTGQRAARMRAGELLEEVGLADRAHHLPARLSGGQQQRVAIARAIAMGPPLILADEPTAHLDYIQVETTLRILRRLAAPGRVVIVVTHDDRLLPLADQVIELVPHRPPPSAGPVEVELAAGEVLFQQGETADLIYVVEAGRVGIERTTPDGEVERLAEHEPGTCFGEMGPLFGLPRSATARALVPTIATGYPVTDFRQVMGIERLEGLVRQERFDE